MMKEQAGSLLAMVSRFTLGGERAADAVPKGPVPKAAAKLAAIRVRPAAALPPALASAAVQLPAHGSAGNGEWKEV